MPISLIAALSNNYVIGVENTMPWHLPRDLKHFKQLTLNKKVIFGRKTFAAIGSRPLPGRTNIIMTRDTTFSAEGCLVVHSPSDALALIENDEELMIAGGSQIYELFLHDANKMYLSFVDTEVSGDSYFPRWDKTQWREISQTRAEADEKNAFAITFVTLERI